MIVNVDVVGLEVLCAAFLSKDEVLYQELREGVDIHSVNQEAFGLPTRLVTKVLKFRIIYGGSEYGFVKDPDFINEAIIRMYYMKEFETEQYKLVIDHETDDFILYEFNKNHEEGDIESVLSAIAPLTKSISLLPHSNVGIYPQMPEEGISKEEYERRMREIKEINWSLLSGHDGEGESFCSGDTCNAVY